MSTIISKEVSEYSNKFILGIMHPRRLDYFLESLKKIDYIDIVLAKNMLIVDALEKLRNFTLEHGYEYLILTSDDVIIPYEAPLKIMTDCILHKYKIITGYSRIKPTRPELNINLEPIYDIDRKVGRPVWFHEYNFLKDYQIWDYLNKGEYIIPVWFVGWSLTAIHRKVLERIEFRGWYQDRIWINNKRYVWNVSCDLAFSYDTWKLGVKKYCDLTVYIPHIPARTRTMRIGIEEPKIEFIEKKKDIQ